MNEQTIRLLEYYEDLVNRPILNIWLLITVYVGFFIVCGIFIIKVKWCFENMKLMLYLTFLTSIFTCLCMYKVSEMRYEDSKKTLLIEKFNELDSKVILKDLENDNLMKGTRYLEIRKIVKKTN